MEIIRLEADAVQSLLAEVTPVRVSQTFFVGAASTALLVYAIPALRARFLAYGPRTTVDQPNVAEKPLGRACDSGGGPVDRLLDYLATWQVPHAYFWHFYIVSVLSSLFWAYQLLKPDSYVKSWLQNTHTDRERSMSAEQVVLTWSIMALQGFRRLGESVLSSKPTTSRMSFMHWLLGIAFYLAMGVAVWSEGVDAILSGDLNPSNLRMSAPSIRTMLSVPVFLIASGIQHDCHTYLAALPKYTLPIHPAFYNLLCPHYTAECVIYLSMAFIAAPNGSMVNSTIFTALLFVSINLGITASLSREWYAKKFGAETVRKKWNLIPYVF